jgi:hypothetical protein
MTLSQFPPPGWYADPYGAPIYRWWDGQAWTEYTSGGQPTASAPQAVATPASPVYATPGAPTYAATISPAYGTPNTTETSAGFYGGLTTTELRPAPKHRPVTPGSSWDHNQYAFLTFALVAVYIFIAVTAHIYILGALPLVMSVRSKGHNESLALYAIIAAAVGVLVGVLGLTNSF